MSVAAVATQALKSKVMDGPPAIQRTPAPALLGRAQGFRALLAPWAR